MYVRVLGALCRLGVSAGVSLADSALLTEASTDELVELCLDRCRCRVLLGLLEPIVTMLPFRDSVTVLCSPVAKSMLRSRSPTVPDRSQSLPWTLGVCPVDTLREH